MASLGETFEVSALPQGNSGNFDPLPPGWYSATMSAAEIKATKTGTGQYIALRYDITGPTHQGRVVFGNLNIRNQSPKAEEIGRQQLGDICRAIGLAKVGDTDQLIGNSLMIKLDIEKSEQYGDKNQVKAFKPIAGGAPPVVNNASSARSTFNGGAAPAAAPAKAAPPWAKK
jgi:hypothetical protein